MPKAKTVKKLGKIQSAAKAAKSAIDASSTKQKAIVAGGTLAVVALLTTKPGRGLLKVAAGLAAPILATVARKKVVQVVAARV
jgi:hypothetical protein